MLATCVTSGQDLSSCNKDQESYAEAGYLTAAIDCRYHGARSSSPTQYSEALISAWRGTSQERPFLLDNVWDLTHLLDVITARDDVDVSRIGMTGISLGGMHTWLAAALDDRISVAAPMIGGRVDSIPALFAAADADIKAPQDTAQHTHGHVNSIPALLAAAAADMKPPQGRVDSIPALFAAAAADTKAPQVTAGLVQNVWDKLMPGLLTDYDSPMSLALIAPRPLLIANGECHVPGVEEALQGARQAYRAAGAEEKLEFWVDKGRGHEVSPTMKAKVRAWFDIYLGTKPLVESQQ
eukprot:gene29250-12496_t